MADGRSGRVWASSPRRSSRKTRALAALLASISLLPVPAAATESGVFEAISRDGFSEGLNALLERVRLKRDRTELDRELARQLRLLRRVAAVSPRSLLPVAVIYDRAYDELRATQRAESTESTERPAQAFQIRALLTQLIELHDAAAEDFEEQAVAADLYVLLAATFFEQQSDLLGIKYLRRALELDPTNATALLELSKAQELRGKHEQALALLEDLHAMGLAGAEAGLRFALNASRSGRTDEAAAELLRVTESEGAPWIRLVATQELARIELESQRFGPAGDAIARGLAEFPEDCTLLIAALYVAERGGPAALSSLTTDSLSACGGDRAQSARMRYASRDPADLKPLRARLAARAEPRRAELGDALDALPQEPKP